MLKRERSVWIAPTTHRVSHHTLTTSHLLKADHKGWCGPFKVQREMRAYFLFRKSLKWGSNSNPKSSKFGEERVVPRKCFSHCHLKNYMCEQILPLWTLGLCVYSFCFLLPTPLHSRALSSFLVFSPVTLTSIDPPSNCRTVDSISSSLPRFLPPPRPPPGHHFPCRCDEREGRDWSGLVRRNAVQYGVKSSHWVKLNPILYFIIKMGYNPIKICIPAFFIILQRTWVWSFRSS